MSKTLIIDGNNLVHRTFWTAKNQVKRYNEGNLDKIAGLHIYFTLNAIFSYVRKYKPTQTICVWDYKPDYKPNVRKDQLDGYKGNRSKDSSPHEQNETITRLLLQIGIKSIFPREREADDIVAYICKTFEGKKVIASVDKDFLQLVNSDTIMFDPIRKREYSHDTFVDDTGYTMEEWLPAKCLLGDKSDNVPGIPRFGKARVRKWLDKELQLTEEQEEIYEKNMTVFNLCEIMTHKTEADYYQEQLDVDINYEWSEFLYECEELELKNILKKKEDWYSTFILSHRLTSMFS